MYPYNIEKEEEDNTNTSFVAMSQSKINQDTQKNSREITKHAKPDEKLLEMIREAIKSETEDTVNYESLVNRINAREDKEILRSIKMNSIKAERLLKQIYMKITETNYGESVTTYRKEAEQSTKGGMGEELLDCMFDCLNDVEFYRKMYFAFINLDIRDMLYEIITDNQSDSTKFMYLETKYRV